MLITTFGLKSWPLFSVAHWTRADWKWQCCCWRMLTSIIIIIIYSNIPHFLVSEMFMKNVKWWKVRTFSVSTSLTFIWTGLHHPCLPGISPISPIVWTTNTSPVQVGVMVSGDGWRLTGWSDGPGVWVCFPGVTADSQCLGIHCESEKSPCSCWDVYSDTILRLIFQ